MCREKLFATLEAAYENLSGIKKEEQRIMFIVYIYAQLAPTNANYWLCGKIVNPCL